MTAVKTTCSRALLRKILTGATVLRTGKLSTVRKADISKIVYAKDVSREEVTLETTISEDLLGQILSGATRVRPGKLSPVRKADISKIVYAKDASVRRR